MVYSAFNITLSSGEVVSVVHTSNGSTVSLGDTQWDLCKDIPYAVWDRLNSDDRCAITLFVDHMYDTWLVINQHP